MGLRLMAPATDYQLQGWYFDNVPAVFVGVVREHPYAAPLPPSYPPAPLSSPVKLLLLRPGGGYSVGQAPSSFYLVPARQRPEIPKYYLTLDQVDHISSCSPISIT